MLTDMKQTGVPSAGAFGASGIRARTQLVKPNQAVNIGRSLPQNQNLSPAVSMQQEQAPQSQPSFNPIFQAPPAQGFGAEPAPASMPIGEPFGEELPFTQELLRGAPEESVQAQELDFDFDERFADAVPYSEQQQSHKEAARQAIRAMSSADIMELLDELANGSLYGID